MADDQLRDGDIETLDKRGQWVNRVIGHEEISESFSSREEAIEEGQKLAAQLGSHHIVRPAEPEGVITDPVEET